MGRLYKLRRAKDNKFIALVYSQVEDAEIMQSFLKDKFISNQQKTPPQEDGVRTTLS
jgi:hypothetical protein